jgi:hypothetical protein
MRIRLRFVVEIKSLLPTSKKLKFPQYSFQDINIINSFTLDLGIPRCCFQQNMEPGCIYVTDFRLHKLHAKGLHNVKINLIIEKQLAYERQLQC